MVLAAPNTMKILLCMLVRNERACLEDVLPTVPPPGPEAGYDAIVAVDGSSTDGTVEFLEAAGIEVMRQSSKGRGAACIEVMARYPADAWLFFSPDGNEDVKDFPKFREHLEAGADLVIASRMCKGAVNEEDHVFFLLRFRKLANLAFNLGANLFFRKTGPYITDSINGFRAIRKSLADRIQLDAAGYTIEYQMAMRSLAIEAKIVEFPTHEYPRIAGETGAPSFQTGLRFIRCFFQELARKSR
jgi:glycosyltransferase involved in cell wall biosynthesis